MNFQNQVEYLPTMFDDITIPADLDRNTVISNIMKRCGLLSPVYSEPELMKDAIDLWFASNQWTLEHLINIIKAEYSPIENTDRYDEQTRTISRELDRDDTFNETQTLAKNSTDTLRKSGTDTLTKTGTDTLKTDAETTVDASNEAIDSVSAFDTDNWSNSSKREENNGSTTSTDGTEQRTLNTSEAQTLNTTETRTLGGSDTQTHGGTNGRDESEDTTDHFTQHLHGNIGVTTNQEMINQELDLLQKFHIYDWIAMQIETDLFIMLY